MFLLKLYRIFVQVAALPIFLGEYFARETGREYGIGFWTKLRVAVRMVRNNRRIVSGSSFLEHLLMATAILRVPKGVEGSVVECGTYKGVSAANLSLVCALTGRTLDCYDSFGGLPEASEVDRAHVLLNEEQVHRFATGSWTGTLDEVKANVGRYGAIGACRFHPGLFADTLPSRTGPSVLVWLDVDYRTSLETAVQWLWPTLQDGCRLYTHEASHLEMAELFFDQAWWRAHTKEPKAPGLVGAGCGLGIIILHGTAFNSTLGYTIKHPDVAGFRPVLNTEPYQLKMSGILGRTEGGPPPSAGPG